MIDQFDSFTNEYSIKSCNIRLTTYDTISSNDLLHNSKEFSSLYMYDNEARTVTLFSTASLR